MLALLRSALLWRTLALSSVIGVVLSLCVTFVFNRGLSGKAALFSALYGLFVGNFIGLVEYLVASPIAERVGRRLDRLAGLVRASIFFVFAVLAYLVSLLIYSPFNFNPFAMGRGILVLFLVLGGVSALAGILMSTFDAMREELRRSFEKLRDQELIERELAVAREVQADLLPAELPPLAGWETFIHFQAAREVGGDYYDLVPLDGEVLVVIADVSGKGVPAAMVMANLQAALRALAAELPPVELVARLNRILCDNTRVGVFVTLFCGRLDPATGQLAYVNAGHEPPLVVRASGETVQLESGGPVLGFLPEATFDHGQVRLEHGDILALCTDGLTEAGVPELDPWGEERLEALVVEHRQLALADLGPRILAAVDDYAPDPAGRDDLALIVLRRAAVG